MKKHGIFIGVAAGLTMAWIGSASADVLNAVTRTIPITGAGLAVFVQLTDGGATSVAFVTTVANQRVVVTYNAECRVTALDHVTWLNTDILVDGIVAPPSTSDNALCTSNNNVSGGNWVSATTTVVRIVPFAGVHTVSVRATLVGFAAGESWRLDDSALVIER